MVKGSSPRFHGPSSQQPIVHMSIYFGIGTGTGIGIGFGVDVLGFCHWNGHCICIQYSILVPDSC